MEDYSAYTDEELIMRIHNDKNDHGDNNEIMDYILEKYKPLVRKKTNALYLIGGENDDLIQEGMIGLFKAVRDYKSDKEASFYSFAQLCITRQLSSALEASNRRNICRLTHIYPFRRVTVMVQSLKKCCKMILQVLSSFS